MLGPKQQLLASYITSADDTSLDGASTQWKTGEGLLRRLATELDTKAGSIGKDERFSGESAQAASRAFADSATKMNDRADQMRDGSGAFTAAAHAVRQAQKASTGFSKHSGDQPPQQPPDLNDVQAQRDWKTQNNSFWHSYNSREGDASDAISALQDNHRTQAAVFAKIHGETPPAQPSGGGGTNSSIPSRTPYTPTHVPTHMVTHGTDGPGHNNDGGNNDDGHDNGHTHPPVVAPPPWDPPAHTHQPPGTPGVPGIPQGPHPSSPLPGGTLPGGTVPGTIPGGVGGGPGAIGGVGAVAGGALGGAAAAGLAGGLAGGLNGGLNGLVPIAGSGVRGGLSASGVRGIGATSRIGTGSVLGRSTGATGRAGAGGMSTRSGGRAGSRTLGSRGSRGRAGSRGSGAGAGAGRNGKDKKRQGEERDLFDDGSDWIDDEDVAPGILD